MNESSKSPCLGPSFEARQGVASRSGSGKTNDFRPKKKPRRWRAEASETVIKPFTKEINHMNNATDLAPVVQHPSQNVAYESLGAVTAKGLHDVFVHLWTRCDEASSRAAHLSKRKGWPLEALEQFGVISRMTDSRSIYGYMQKLLSAAAVEHESRCKSLREQLSTAYGENARLKRELGEAVEMLNFHMRRGSERRRDEVQPNLAA